MSTVNDAMIVIRQRVNDNDKINYSDAEIVNDVATACRYLGLALIARKAPEMIVAEDVVDFTAVPKGFHSFVGQYPVWREGPVLRTSTGNDSTSIRYFNMPEKITSLNNTIPFSDNYFDVIVTTAAALLLNRDEFDTTTEKSMIESITALLPGGTS